MLRFGERILEDMADSSVQVMILHRSLSGSMCEICSRDLTVELKLILPAHCLLVWVWVCVGGLLCTFCGPPFLATTFLALAYVLLELEERTYRRITTEVLLCLSPSLLS